jgi:hypothetical protein
LPACKTDGKSTARNIAANRVSIGQYNNLTIWGTAQMSSNCATYNYTIGNTTSPQLTPNATQVPGTAITPSPTGDAKGLTAVLSTTNNAGRVAKISGSLILGVAAIFISYL